MTASLTLSLFERLNPLRLAGPLLERELRVSSRRGRTYVLRIAYVGIMCLFALAAWYSIMSVPTANARAFGVSRSSLVAGRVTAQILWFQFMAAQLITAAMLSSAMTDEMHRGGLSILLTTPISSLQIVLGKLLSRMWQIILLLTICLPALAVVRVMGGVSWGVLTSSLCITLTASVFVGALCLWLSTYCRYPYQVISSAAVIYLVLFIALPGVAMVALAVAGLDESAVSSIILLANPRPALYKAMYPAQHLGVVWPGYGLPWSVHCLAMLGLTAALVGHCAWRIRRASVRTLGMMGARKRRSMRRYRSPVVWREFVGNLSCWKWGSLLLVTGAAAVCALIVVGRIVLGRRAPVQINTRYVAWAFWMIALLRLAVLAAGAIAREKEGGTLALLLTTPLDARQIVRGKLRAVVDRGMPWVLAALVVQTVSIACTVDWGQVWVVPCYVVATLVSAFFVTTAGLYFGARLATATAAVVATLGTHLCLRYLVIGHYNPVYIWLWYKIILTPRPSGRTMAFFSVGTFLIVAVLQVGLGLFLLRRAAGTLRRYV